MRRSRDCRSPVCAPCSYTAHLSQNPKPGQKHFSEMPMPRAEVERLLKGRFASRNARITLGLAILGPTYSIYDVTRQDLQLARELDLVASMHVAGVTPVSPDGFRRIVADDLISDKTNIVHGNDLTDEELRQLTRTRGAVHRQRRRRTADGLR